MYLRHIQSEEILSYPDNLSVWTDSYPANKSRFNDAPQATSNP
jgi:hypothetical protein